MTDDRLLGRQSRIVRLRCTPDVAEQLANALARRPDTSHVDLISGGTEVLCAMNPRSRQARNELLFDRCNARLRSFRSASTLPAAHLLRRSPRLARQDSSARTRSGGGTASPAQRAGSRPHRSRGSGRGAARRATARRPGSLQRAADHHRPVGVRCQAAPGASALHRHPLLQSAA